MFENIRFILHEPSHPGNVGASARAIKTMGFGRLSLVIDEKKALLEDVRQSSQAIAMASGAQDVLGAARLAKNLNEAMSDAHWTVALTARDREYGPPRLSLEQAAQQAVCYAQAGQRIAFVFGNERSGLSNESVEQCRAIVHISANPLYSSLNLSQAVQLVAYALRTKILDLENAISETPQAPIVLASHANIQGMFEHLEQALIALHFLDSEQPKKLMARLHQLFARSGLSAEEVNILRGIAKHILEQSK